MLESNVFLSFENAHEVITKTQNIDVVKSTSRNTNRVKETIKNEKFLSSVVKVLVTISAEVIFFDVGNILNSSQPIGN